MDKKDVIYDIMSDEGMRVYVAHSLMDDEACRAIFAQALSSPIHDFIAEKRDAHYFRKAISAGVIALGFYAKDIFDFIVGRLLK